VTATIARQANSPISDVGYRIIYEVIDDQLVVLAIRVGRRDDVYRSR
jgi:mRNA-degrading endonuclease RelE of RelBE toxin-antitoxin system